MTDGFKECFQWKNRRVRNLHPPANEAEWEAGLNVRAAAIRGEDMEKPDGPTADAIRKRIFAIFDELPLEGRLKLLEEAWGLNEFYKVTKKW